MISLLMGLFLSPVYIYAIHYKCIRLKPFPNFPVKAPARYFIGFDLDCESGDFCITPNYDIAGLNIKIESNGVNYLDTTVSLTAGQSYFDSLDSYGEGTYTLTLSTADGVIDTYTITVEDD